MDKRVATAKKKNTKKFGRHLEPRISGLVSRGQTAFPSEWHLSIRDYKRPLVLRGAAYNL